MCRATGYCRRVGRRNRHHWLRPEPQIGMGTVPNSPSLAVKELSSPFSAKRIWLASGRRRTLTGGLLPRATLHSAAFAATKSRFLAPFGMTCHPERREGSALLAREEVQD